MDYANEVIVRGEVSLCEMKRSTFNAREYLRLFVQDDTRRLEFQYFADDARAVGETIAVGDFVEVRGELSGRNKRDQNGEHYIFVSVLTREVKVIRKGENGRG